MTPTELFHTIQYRLADKTPTSVVRIGDGEAVVLNGFNDQPKLEWVMKRQLGYMPEPEQIKEIKQNLITAYQDADFIGVPQNKREGLNDYWYKCLDILEKNIGSLNDKKLTSVDFHNDWLTAGYFDRLFQSVDKLMIISCRNLSSAFFRKYPLLVNHQFHIAPEMKFTPDYKGPLHYPGQFNFVQKWMDSVPIEGSLCLVGAGVAGKIYCKWFKDRGGIALDIGNVFDAWAGLVTRGKDRGVGVIDNTYKL